MPEPTQAPIESRSLLRTDIKSQRLVDLERPGATTSRPTLSSDAAREAALESVYAARRELLHTRRTGGLSPSDEQHLADLEQYINQLEGPEAKRARQDDIWVRLDRIAESVLALQERLHA